MSLSGRRSASRSSIGKATVNAPAGGVEGNWRSVRWGRRGVGGFRRAWTADRRKRQRSRAFTAMCVRGFSTDGIWAGMTAFDYERLFEALPQPHALFDKDLRFVAANGALEASLGLSAVDLCGRSVFDVFPDGGEAGDRLRLCLDRVLQSGRRSSIAFLRHDRAAPEPASGEADPRYWSLTCSPILDVSGQTEFIVASIANVTERGRADRERQGCRRGLSGDREPGRRVPPSVSPGAGHGGRSRWSRSGFHFRQ